MPPTVTPAELARLQREAESFLTPLLAAPPEALAAALRPRDEDYARVFPGAAAETARAAYAALWASPPRGLAQAGQTRVVARAATAAALGEPGPARDAFPGGYAQIAAQLAPDLVWIAFDVLAPGETAGMSYDGLVWLDGRWAWFPKPWRALRAPATN